jgi:hypothetical protein
MGLVDMVRQNMAKALGGAQPAMVHALHNFWLVDKDVSSEIQEPFLLRWLC